MRPELTKGRAPLKTAEETADSAKDLKFITVRSRRDVDKVSALAQMIWSERHGSSAGGDAIFRSGAKRQEPAAIVARTHEGFEYDFITEEGQLIGYAAFRTEKDAGELLVDRLYLARALMNRSRFHAIIAKLRDIALDAKVIAIRLVCDDADRDVIEMCADEGFADAGSMKEALEGGRALSRRALLLTMASPSRYEADYLEKRASRKGGADAEDGVIGTSGSGDDNVEDHGGGEHAAEAENAEGPRTRAKGAKLPENDRLDYPLLAQTYADDISRLPRFGLGAFLLTPIWAPAHGFWIAVLLYPAWVFVDSLFRQAYLQQTAWSWVVAALICLATVGVSAWIAVSGQRNAYLRVAGKVPLKTYLARERIWNILSVPVAIAVLAFATYYNLVVFPTL